MKRVHFIAIGGSAMHNLAIALHLKGYQVTGSDDEIFEPSKGRLDKYGILPKSIGWNTENISTDIEAVILGMHARSDNPELLKAKELGLKIYSYPEYLYEQTKNKTRVVIGGSHGKTSITAMILHVLNHHNMNADYMVGAQLDGFEVMVKLTEDADVVILEGDEYLSSPIDRRPKFHLYHPNIALLSGIAWDHINVFPTFENYVEQFEIFVNKIEENGSLIYCELDENVKEVSENNNNSLNKFPYSIHRHRIENGTTILIDDTGETPLKIFGDHNLQNLSGAKLICAQIGVNTIMFNEAIKSFTGASKRLELIAEGESCKVFKDFAHSPSKLKATTNAVKKQFETRTLVACMELHTFSSLNEEFLAQYNGAMDAPDVAIVYFSPEAIAHKKLKPITEQQVKAAFMREDLMVFTNSEELKNYLNNHSWNQSNLLLMSSGNFGGIKLEELNACQEKISQ